MEQWREQVIAAGARPTPVIDRFYFESVYFREPSGILYELATFDGAGFDVDEPAATMGEPCRCRRRSSRCERGSRRP